MERTREPLAQPNSESRAQPLRVVRVVQAVLVAIIVVAAFLTAPGAPASLTAAQRLESIEQDRLVAAFADAVAEALASLQEQDGAPFGSGYLGSDRGEVFAGGTPNYDRSIAELLVERGLLDPRGVDEIARTGVRVIAHQCGTRVAVIATSNVEVPNERRIWWDENACDRGLAITVEWPTYLALSDEPAGAN